MIFMDGFQCANYPVGYFLLYINFIYYNDTNKLEKDKVRLEKELKCFRVQRYRVWKNNYISPAINPKLFKQ